MLFDKKSTHSCLEESVHNRQYRQSHDLWRSDLCHPLLEDLIKEGAVTKCAIVTAPFDLSGIVLSGLEWIRSHCAGLDDLKVGSRVVVIDILLTIVLASHRISEKS